MDKLKELLSVVDNYFDTLDKINNYIISIENELRAKKFGIIFSKEIQKDLNLEWGYEEIERKEKKPKKNWRLFFIYLDSEVRQACIEAPLDYRSNYLSIDILDSFLDDFIQFIKSKEKEFKEKTGQ